MGCIETLDGVLDGGLETGRWCWFHDLNNQSLTSRFDRRAKNHLESFDPVRMPLRINCRNTRVILEWIQATLDADLGVHGAGAAPPSAHRAPPPGGNPPSGPHREIGELVDVGGLATRFGDDPVAARILPSLPLP